jgi:hypothetical protein
MHLVMVSICGNLCIEIWGDVFNLEVHVVSMLREAIISIWEFVHDYYITICILIVKSF